MPSNPIIRREHNGIWSVTKRARNVKMSPARPLCVLQEEKQITGEDAGSELMPLFEKRPDKSPPVPNKG